MRTAGLTRRFHSALAAASVAVVAAACGGGGGDKASPPTTSVASTLGSGGSEDEIAKRAVLRRSDLPADWTAEPHTDPEDPEIDRQMAACLGTNISFFADNPNAAESPDFTSPTPGLLRAQNSVEIAESAAKLQGEADVFTQPGAEDCLSAAVSEALQKQIAKPPPGEELPPGASLGQIVTTRAEFPTMGDRTIAYRLVVPLETAEAQLTIYQDFVAVIKGRAVASFTFLGFGAPFPDPLARELVQKVVDRLPAS